ncbi:proline-rich protein 2-like [Lagenorhynchus albirostris]|uniref:proline-rich protein 2-like n=1 Tax=Lagenorhynchus albirostris TaxID=27610 RepID=UPI0028E7011F|nr:proline-rich protein 2-like [Lagenorhynchus albirostris]
MPNKSTATTAESLTGQHDLMNKLQSTSLARHAGPAAGGDPEPLTFVPQPRPPGCRRKAWRPGRAAPGAPSAPAQQPAPQRPRHGPEPPAPPHTAGLPRAPAPPCGDELIQSRSGAAEKAARGPRRPERTMWGREEEERNTAARAGGQQSRAAFVCERATGARPLPPPPPPAPPPPPSPPPSSTPRLPGHSIATEHGGCADAASQRPGAAAAATGGDLARGEAKPPPAGAGWKRLHKPERGGRAGAREAGPG